MDKGRFTILEAITSHLLVPISCPLLTWLSHASRNRECTYSSPWDRMSIRAQTVSASMRSSPQDSHLPHLVQSQGLRAPGPTHRLQYHPSYHLFIRLTFSPAVYQQLCLGPENKGETHSLALNISQIERRQKNEEEGQLIHPEDVGPPCVPEGVWEKMAGKLHPEESMRKF